MARPAAITGPLKSSSLSRLLTDSTKDNGDREVTLVCTLKMIASEGEAAQEGDLQLSMVG